MNIQTAQSLHPGGKYYPQDNKQQQMSRPGSRNGNPQLSPDIPSEYDQTGRPATLQAQDSNPMDGRPNTVMFFFN